MLEVLQVFRYLVFYEIKLFFIDFFLIILINDLIREICIGVYGFTAQCTSLGSWVLPKAMKPNVHDTIGPHDLPPPESLVL